MEPDVSARADYRPVPRNYDTLVPLKLKTLLEFPGLTTDAMAKARHEYLRAGADPSHLRKLRVYGLDLPASAGSALPALDGVLAYLGQVDTAEAGRVRLTLLPLAGRAAGSNWQLAQRRYDSLPPAARDSLTREAEALVTRLDAAQDRGDCAGDKR